MKQKQLQLDLRNRFHILSEDTEEKLGQKRKVFFTDTVIKTAKEIVGFE